MLTTSMGLYKRGTYVKVILKGMTTELTPGFPIVLARINVGEDNQGLVKVALSIECLRYESKSTGGTQTSSSHMTP